LRHGKEKLYDGNDSFPPQKNCTYIYINASNAELNPIRHFLALVGAHHIVHVSRLRVNLRNVIPKIHLCFCAVFVAGKEVVTELNTEKIVCMFIRRAYHTAKAANKFFENLAKLKIYWNETDPNLIG
jgi:hypothetical protein